tara:strand:- start:620 stop:1219 length:600 start_codon:yes stop_codon:yes gene_type:complete
MRINEDPRQFNNWIDAVVRIFRYLNSAFFSIDLLADKISTESSSGSVPAPFLQKTATQISYPDGTVLQGWKLTGGMLLTGSNIYSEVQGTLTVGSYDANPANAGFYIAYDLRGSVKAIETAAPNTFDVINSFGSGADMQDTTTGALVKSDYMGVSLDDDGNGEYIISLKAAGGNANPCEAEVFYQFEFLCYSEVTPQLS